MKSTPPMGWNSWNTFYDQIDEKLALETADAMIAEGLRDLGYEYVILDDCWALRERVDGRLVPDPKKFPHCMKALADAVHARGMKLGLYGCCGVRTCAGYPGSFDHEYQDARQMAEWSIDYLKYDNCNRPSGIGSELLYRRMALALRSTGRDILLAACQWGTEHVENWIRSTGAGTFRSTVDIRDGWFSIEAIARARLEHLNGGAPFCHDDMDMLVVGMNGAGVNPEVRMTGCTDEEYRTHFALWAFLNSPLVIGCDVRSLAPETRAILRNRDLIRVNQDAEGRAPYKVPVYGNDDAFVLVKALTGGELALGFFNFGDAPANVPLALWDIGLTLSSTKVLRLRDCYAQSSAGVFGEHFMATVPPHGSRVYLGGLEERS